MAEKKVPVHLYEFLEKLIVRGSRGYEPVEKAMRAMKEEDLRAFLEFYESKVRLELQDQSSSSSESEDLLGDSVSRLLAKDKEKEEADSGLLGLVSSLSKD